MSCGLLAVCLAAASAGAHGDVHGQIEALTRQIASQARNPALYLHRGELHRVHGDFDAALKDYAQTSRLDPAMDLDFVVGRALLEAGRPKDARPRLDHYAARHPADFNVFVVRARTLHALGARVEALADYDRAVGLDPSPKPDVLLERARLLVALGRSADALSGLDAAMGRIGHGPALEHEALDLEVTLGRFDAALARIDRLSKGAPRLESWHARRGEVLAAAGRVPQAREAYALALRAIESLPAERRRARALADLESRVRLALDRIAS